MAYDLNKRREEAATTPDLTKARSGGGGDYAPPAEGVTRTRLTGYVEYGVHTKKSGQYVKTKPRVELTFELSGPKHAPKDLDDGKKIPQRITVKEIVGDHIKNGYMKLFNLLNVDKDARNYLDLLLVKGWRAEVSHWSFKGQDGKDRTIAQLRSNGVYTFKPTTYQDEESGETKQVAVPPAIGPLRIFLWNDGDLEQWDTLLDYQKNLIRTAENFEGSAIQLALVEAGREAELAVTTRDGDQQSDTAADEDEAEPVGAPAAEEPVAPKAPAKAVTKAAAAAPKAPTKAAATKAPAKGSDPLQGL